jgi:hypothetical protein
MTGEEGHLGRHGKHGRYGDRHRLTGRCGALMNAGGSDEARDASLAVRRAKAAKRKKADAKQEAEERKKKRWMDEHPGAKDADWQAHDQKRYEEWKRKNPRGKK